MTDVLMTPAVAVPVVVPATPVGVPLTQLWYQAPLLILVIGACAVLLAEAFARRGGRWVTGLGAAVVLAALVSLWAVWRDVAREGPQILFHGMVVVDTFALFMCLVFLVGGFLVLLSAGDYLAEHELNFGEFTPVVLLGLAGMVMLAMAGDLVTVFIGIETMSIAVYVLTGAGSRQVAWGPVAARRSAEGAMKYFIIGAFASGFLVYGIALVYGMTGSTNLAVIALADATVISDPVFLGGMFLLLAAFGFKVAAVPFHMWAPDAYEGAPTPVTGFMAATVKAAGFAGLIRVFVVTFGGDFLPFGRLGWGTILGLIAAVTMTWGNVAALRQENVKRMLAYSSIAHAGYLLIGVIAAGVGVLTMALPALLFYLMAYTFTTLGVFGVVAWVGSRGDERLLVDDWAGVGQKHPAIALAMVLFLLSLAGFPPTGGFFGKFYLFRAAIEVPGNQLLWLVVLGVLNSVVSVFYYLRLIVAMYFRDPRPRAGTPLSRPAVLLALAICALMVLQMGLIPGFWIDLTRSASLL